MLLIAVTVPIAVQWKETKETEKRRSVTHIEVLGEVLKGEVLHLHIVTWPLASPFSSYQGRVKQANLALLHHLPDRSAGREKDAGWHVCPIDMPKGESRLPLGWHFPSLQNPVEREGSWRGSQQPIDSGPGREKQVRLTFG